jgi:hypothetical protein
MREMIERVRHPSILDLYADDQKHKVISSSLCKGRSQTIARLNRPIWLAENFPQAARQLRRRSIGKMPERNNVVFEIISQAGEAGEPQALDEISRCRKETGDARDGVAHRNCEFCSCSDEGERVT